MPIKWQRPASVPYPNIWKYFEGRREINGKIPKFWIQDIPEEMFEEAVEAMCVNYIYEEPLCKYSSIVSCPESVAEFKETWREVLKHKMGLICFMENPDPEGKPIIAGLNITYICEKDEQIPEKHKKCLKISETVQYICHVKDPFTILGIDFYLSALGLTVFPEFRGQNIGFELLMTRDDLCRATGIKATLTVFSATTSQRLAARAAFKDLVSLPYEEVKNINPKYNFPGISQHTPNIKFMYKVL